MKPRNPFRSLILGQLALNVTKRHNFQDHEIIRIRESLTRRAFRPVRRLCVGKSSMMARSDEPFGMILRENELLPAWRNTECRDNSALETSPPRE